ncbi:hypothetical protein PFISCL1PPCAC_19876 [Pristionchus fissidentatus]|uniref:Uncharacterized protein n=1 Tax=Pristionchus fissidentatus TaxID=1538716 RepID=A0AAV5W9B8_9BILA|nr:hypothetical protein PFISCL1PPCAC_19876 [Pristionchus fissidentatus]
MRVRVSNRDLIDSLSSTTVKRMRSGSDAAVNDSSKCDNDEEEELRGFVAWLWQIYTRNKELSIGEVHRNYVEGRNKEQLKDSLREFASRSSSSFMPFDFSSIMHLNEMRPEEGWSQLVGMVSTLAAVTSREFSRAATRYHENKSVRMDSRPGSTLKVTFSRSQFNDCDGSFLTRHTIPITKQDGSEFNHDNVAMMRGMKVSTVGVHLYEAQSRVVLEALRMTSGEEIRHYSGYTNQRSKFLLPVPFEWLSSVTELSYLGFSLDSQVDVDERDLVKSNLTHAARTIISNYCDKQRQVHKRQTSAKETGPPTTSTAD